MHLHCTGQHVRRRRDYRVSNIWLCVYRPQEKTVLSFVTQTPAGPDQYAIFLSKGLTFIEKVVPRLTESQPLGYFQKNVQFRVVAGLKCIFFFLDRLLLQHNIFPNE